MDKRRASCSGRRTLALAEHVHEAADRSCEMACDDARTLKARQESRPTLDASREVPFGLGLNCLIRRSAV